MEHRAVSYFQFMENQLSLTMIFTGFLLCFVQVKWIKFGNKISVFGGEKMTQKRIAKCRKLVLTRITSLLRRGDVPHEF